MAWKWKNPFKRGGGKAPKPTPAPTAKPTAPAGPAGEPKKGLFGRLFGGRKKKEPTGAAPKEPAAGGGPAVPPGGRGAPPTGGPAEGPAEGEGWEGGGGQEEEEEEERHFPGSLGVSADGVWRISSTEWDGIMTGVLHGQDVKDFILAMEAGDRATAAHLVAMAYDDTVGSLLNPDDSIIRRIGY